MVRFFKFFLLSFFVGSCLSANGDRLTQIAFDDVQKMDLSETTLAFGAGMVQGLQENNLFYDKDGFFIVEDDNVVRVNSYDTDKLFHGRDQDFVARYAQIGKFKVSRFDNGEYSVTSTGGLKGGGIFGAYAGAILGKAVVHFVGHGTILIISACTGPAAPATFAALEAALLPTVIEPVSNVAAVGMGIAGGVATGPV